MFGIFLACFLKYLSSDIVLILNRMNPNPVRFRSFMDVVEGLDKFSFSSYPLRSARLVETFSQGRSQGALPLPPPRPHTQVLVRDTH